MGVYLTGFQAHTQAGGRVVSPGNPAERGVGPLRRYWRLYVFVIVTGLALAGYFLDLAGREVYLFIAGLSGGAALGEIGWTLGLRELNEQFSQVSRQNQDLQAQVLSAREPVLAAAVRLGVSFVTVNSPPDSRDARFLEVVDEVKSSADANDLSEILDALRTRWGEPISESFLLGRQLALVLVPADGTVSSETRSLILDRLKLRVTDERLAKAVDHVLEDAHGMDENTQAQHLQYMGRLIEYLSRSTTMPEARQLREQLLLGRSAVAARADAAQAGRQSEFNEFIERLVKSGAHEKDPDVLLFYAVLKDDTKMAEEALQRGANTSITDIQLMRRYRQRESNVHNDDA
jgi:hypothetical protein